MAFITCTACKKDIKRWDYEIKQIKDPSAYVCKACKKVNAYEDRECPVCNKTFNIRKKLKKVTCSHSCSNKYFRVGEGNGNWNPNAYRSTCFLHHGKSCVVCRENKIVEVHHYDNNHDNNDPANLIPLCPTHHQYIHSKYKKEIVDIVEKYVKIYLDTEYSSIW